MQLTFLGTGTSQGVPVIGCHCAVCRSTDPRDQRLRSSVLVRAEGRSVLIDAGPDLRQQLLRAGVEDLDAVLLTHEHMDHVSGMDDLRAISFKHEPPRDVVVHCDERTLQSIKRVYSYAFRPVRYPGIPQFDMRPIGRTPFHAGGLVVTPIEVMHLHLPVLGFRIGDLTYITDAKTISDTEKDKIRGSRVLVLNALRQTPHISHFNLEEALALIREVAPERAYLTHISHLMGLHAELELPPNVYLAHDGLVVEL